MTAEKSRVLLGMSGGVDSSVAGYLLREQGYDVIGVTMKVWPQDCISGAEDKCCGPQAVADARAVAHSLGIPHYVVDEADKFERMVIDYFTIEHQEDRAVLRKGADPRKDQSYFLFSLRQPQLRRALTPLGAMCKPEIRKIAHSLGLKVADKIDSQEICFVPGNDYKAFLRSHLGENKFHRGKIYDVDGNFVAEHEGIELFTIGQRKGLPGGSARPRYVVDLYPETNCVIVGDMDDLVVDEFEVDRINWIVPKNATEDIDLTVKIRYNHPGTSATVTPLKHNRARIHLHEPQRAVTPGQAAVLYDGDLVIGGGWICRKATAALA